MDFGSGQGWGVYHLMTHISFPCSVPWGLNVISSGRPIGLSSIPGGQGPQLFPYKVSRLPPRKVDLLSPPPVPWVLHLPPSWSAGEQDQLVKINFSSCCWISLNTLHPQPSAKVPMGQALTCRSPRRDAPQWAIYLHAIVCFPAINTAWG